MKTRYREQKRLFGPSFLVLQVSFEVDQSTDDSIPPSQRGVNKFWRDATVEDMQLKEQGR